MQKKVDRQPKLYLRIMLLLSLLGFAVIERNPIVALEAKLGLSPSPIERIFGVKSLFSGMTEGVHQFALLNLSQSIKANIFAPIVIPATVVMILAWKIPTLDSKAKESSFFIVFMFMSAFVNIFNH